MDSNEISKRLVAVGEKIKAKGWESASVDIYVSYLASFDRDPSPLDPMISFRPSIRASTRDKHDIPTSHEFVKGAWDVKTIDGALECLDAAAEAMPTMADESARLANAKAKLSDDERRLLGVR